ncbi:MAG: hypothetical protein R2701_07140 [Acidimicrobiales bacterium]
MPSAGASAPRGERLGVLGVVLGPRLLGLGGLATDEVALVVVGVLAEVLLVLGRHRAALGRLLDRQADPATLEVEVDDLHPELLARGDDLLGEIDVVR